MLSFCRLLATLLSRVRANLDRLAYVSGHFYSQCTYSLFKSSCQGSRTRAFGQLKAGFIDSVTLLMLFIANHSEIVWKKVGDRSQSADDNKLLRIMKRRDRHHEEWEGLAIRTNGH